MIEFKFLRHIRIFLLILCAFLLSTDGVVPDSCVGLTVEAAKKKARKKKSSGSRKNKNKKSKRKSSKKKKGKRGKKRSRKSRGRTARVGVRTLYLSPDSTMWIHKGRREIVICRDSAGVVRAMVPCTINPSAGRHYAAAINEYARALSGDPVRIYSLIAPSQGEYYMPSLTSTIGNERRAINTTAEFLDSTVTPVFVLDTLKHHMSEEIFNRTDHHWSPLGAYYASAAFAKAAGVKFRPLSEYTADTVRNYVGTMYKFSGDPAVKRAPEDFVYFMPPEGYDAEFVTYSLSGRRTSGESAPHKEPFFKKFPDGSGAAYSTFMGGDTRNVKVTSTGGAPGRKLLIVKDSYGNAMAPCLFGSFEEVHVADFRYFPHNLVEYVRLNGITDLLFVNCLQIAFAPGTSSRLMTMLRAKGNDSEVWHDDGDEADEDEALEESDGEEDEEEDAEENEEENEEEGEDE